MQRASNEQILLVVAAAKKFRRNYSTSTVDTYRRIVTSTTQLFDEALSEVEPGDFYKKRAAYQWYLRDQIMANLAAANSLREASDAVGAISRYYRAVALYEHLKSIDLIKAPEGARTIRGNSKRRGLNKLPHDWLQRLAKNLHIESAAAILVTLLSGCRPAEMAKGVEVTAIDDKYMSIKLKGAKVTEATGQKDRILGFDVTKDVVAKQLWLLAVEAGGKLVVQRKVRGLHKAILAACRRAGLPKLSSYTFRHAIASHLKLAFGGDKVLIAKALGHASTATQKMYGTRHQGRTGGTALVTAVASREVREPHWLGLTSNLPSTETEEAPGL